MNLMLLFVLRVAVAFVLLTHFRLRLFLSPSGPLKLARWLAYLCSSVGRGLVRGSSYDHG
jgi:hypothetical protein